MRKAASILGLALLLAFPQLLGGDIEQLEKDASGGDAKAQFELGLIYEDGKGIPKDAKKAVEWFNRAALQGHTGAAQMFFCKMSED